MFNDCPKKKAGPVFILCPTCHNKMQDLTLLRCPRCFAQLYKTGCDGNCNKCEGKK